MAHPAKAGAGRRLRLDPYQPQHSLTVGASHFKLDRNGLVLKRTLDCGLPLSIAVPARAFEGVAARAVESETGEITVTLELKHRDPALCVPLLYANDMDDISADWHSWSRLMKLPMLVIDAENRTTALTRQLGALMVESPIGRRKRLSGVRHRPNFLRRRKPGMIGPVETLTPAEIIARA